MFGNLIERLRGHSGERKGKAPEASSELLAPRIFFTPERMDDIENRLIALGIANNPKFTVLDSEHSSRVRVDFERGGQSFSAEFDVMKEPDQTTYDLKATIYDAKGKELPGRNRKLKGLHYFEVSQQVITSLALAFSQEAS